MLLTAHRSFSLSGSLVLEYGLDEVVLDRGIEITPRGISFTTHWQFPIGTFLNVIFHSGANPDARFELEGCVVDCYSPKEDKTYLLTLFFPDEETDLLSMLSPKEEALLASAQ